MPDFSVRESLGATLLAKRDGLVARVPVTSLDGKYVGLYFSAHWCPPCRNFTPILRGMYAQLQEVKKPFEVVFISSDRSQSEFEDYYSHMPWCAVPFDDAATRRALAGQFGISGIPTLIIIGPDGQVLNRNARMAVIQDRSGERFPWEGQEEPRQFGPWMVIMLMLLLWAIYKAFFEK